MYMDFPEKYRFRWWIALLIFFSSIIIYKLFTTGLTTVLDLIIVLISIVLLLMPLFEEIDIFGLRLKKEIDSLRTDLTSQIINLRSDVQNSIHIGMNQKQIINNYQSPPPDEELYKMEKNYNSFFNEFYDFVNVKKPEEVPDLEVPVEITFLLSTRYRIEKELRRIWSDKFDRETPKYPAIKLLNDLNQHEIIDLEISKAIRDIFRVCNPAIHGEDVKITKTQINFVKDLTPKVISVLEKIPNKF